MIGAVASARHFSVSHVAVVVRLVTEHGSQRVEASEGRSLGVIRGESSSGALKSGESGSVDSERRKRGYEGIVSFLMYFRCLADRRAASSESSSEEMQ